MIETYYAGAYWAARPEPIEACARRAEVLFRELGRIEPVLRHWYKPGKSFEHSRTLHFTPDTVSFLRYFSQADNQVAGGFDYRLWAGENREETVGVDGLCGTSSPRPIPYCVLDLPSQGTLAQRVLTVSALSAILRAMALAWEPLWGVATSHEHRQMVAEGPSVGSFVGWIMYFSRERGRVPALPAPVRVEPVEDKGTLVTLTPERFTASNPEHVALAARVHELLASAGLLQPLIGW